MSSAPAKKVAILNTGLTLSQDEVAKLKPKVLREHLKKSLNVLSEDWHLHLIVEVLADVHGCDLRALTQGVRVTKGAGDTTEYSFRKGSGTDKATKRVAKFFFHNEALLRNYVTAIDLAIGSAGKKPLVLSAAYGYDGEENNGEVIQDRYLRFMKKNDQVYVTEFDHEYVVLADAFGHQGPMIDSLAIRLLKRVAARYNQTVYTSDTTTVVDGKGNEVFLVSFAIME